MVDTEYFSPEISNTLESNVIFSPIKFLKTRDVKSPSRANKYDAGIDFYVPEFTKEFVELLKEKNPEIFIENDYVLLNSNERILIPSGIYCQMASPYRALIAANKSGVSTKLGLVFGAQVVDYEYQGEIHLSLINTSDGAVKITPGIKILQFLETPIFCSTIQIEEGKTPIEFYEKETTRGDSGFGASDKK
jgi:dUTPase